MSFYKYILGLVLIGLAACSTREVEPLATYAGFDYFPLQKGNYIVYDVDSTTWTITAQKYSVHYQIKELVGDSFPDLTGNTAFKIMRYKRYNTAQTWAFDSVWTATRTSRQAIRNENNIPFVRLIFPLQVGNTWNGNQLNVYQNPNAPYYRLDSVGISKQLKGLSFEKCLKVTQANETNFLGKNVEVEYYAQNIGLVSKAVTQIEYLDQSLYGDSVKIGGIYTQTAIEYGKE
ncbi:hypothetical protein SAMN05421780_101160 [Flexibacter flexilis DSM 6793]|uniref:Uncharacterized protein n=1 Tax=Flexibacter flexilis DSM 6793 TaxID=927664 RepID=A0A1I1DKN1_9BACT|nr:hypothetical protein [Flexibacter flexilis]SFB73260.1 hypothetical protein SAMN05421780_101160 [Flexibacter flexilis DSM 6793]